MARSQFFVGTYKNVFHHRDQQRKAPNVKMVVQVGGLMVEGYGSHRKVVHSAGNIFFQINGFKNTACLI